MIQSQFLLKEITFIKNEEKVRILRKLSNSNNYENVLLTSPHPTDKKKFVCYKVQRPGTTFIN